MRLSDRDLATLSLLDPDQGVCPSGHECRLDDVAGYRRCTTCDYQGLALICWEMTFKQSIGAPQTARTRTWSSGRGRSWPIDGSRSSRS